MADRDPLTGRTFPSWVRVTRSSPPGPSIQMRQAGRSIWVQVRDSGRRPVPRPTGIVILHVWRGFPSHASVPSDPFWTLDHPTWLSYQHNVALYLVFRTEHGGRPALSINERAHPFFMGAVMDDDHRAVLRGWLQDTEFQLSVYFPQEVHDFMEREAGLGLMAGGSGELAHSLRHMWGLKPLVFTRGRIRRGRWAGDAQEFALWRGHDPSIESPEMLTDFLHTHFGAFSRWPRTPAALAVKTFRMFLPRPLQAPPEAMTKLAWDCGHRSVIIHAKHPAPYAYMYDMNCAYGAYLDKLPDLSRGRYRPVTKWCGPYGLYEIGGGDAAAGFALASPWNGGGEEHHNVLRGVIWDGDVYAPSPFRRFIAFCYAWSGPFRKLMRRLPVLLVGKFWQHIVTLGQTGEALLEWGWNAIPWIYANVVAGLEAEMRRVCATYHAQFAFVDMAHFPAPLPAAMVGPDLGQWKLIDHGPVTYQGLNRYTLGTTVRHQGVRLG